MNYIVLEVEYVKWDSTKLLHQNRALSKEGLAEFLQICEDNYIEVVPLFQTLGHLEWFFKNGQNLEMAEDPAAPYAYNVSHPKVYPAMDEILTEVLAAFPNAKYLHIGHDEVDMIGRYPYQPKNVKRGMADLIYTDIMHYYDFLKARGIQTMMWHDMILTSAECPNGSGMRLKDVKFFRDMLPKDIVIADWQYTGNQEHAHYNDVKLLMNEGFEVIGCTWYDPMNIENFTTAVKKHGASGMMGTTWTGYFSGWDSFDKYFFQMAPYARVGAWAWRVDNKNLEKHGKFHDYTSNLLLNTVPEFAQPNGALESAGRMVNLDKVANIAITPENSPFMGESGRGIFDEFGGGQIIQVGQVKFMLPVRDGALAAIALRSAHNRTFPDKVALKLDAKAKIIYLLNSNIGPVPNFEQVVATCTIKYADGTKHPVPLIYNRNLGSLTGESALALNAETCYTFKNGDRIWFTEIINPKPEKEIEALEFSGEIIPYYLFGITLVE